MTRGLSAADRDIDVRFPLPRGPKCAKARAVQRLQRVVVMRACPLIILASAGMLAACGDAGGAPADAACHYVDTGECDPPAGSTPLAAPAVELQDECFNHTDTGVLVFTTAAEWDAQFGACMPAPATVDFATQRLALVTTWCTATTPRFVAETAGAIVIGVHESQGGACIQTAVMVTLPRGTKPVRAAHCVVTGEGDCPPLA